MKLSIIIPVYNERDTILQLVSLVNKVDLGSIEKEIIIIDDFSTDGTKELLSKVKNCKVYYHHENQGKGAAVITGIKNCSGDIIVIQDADLEYDPNDFNKMIKPIVEGKTSVVYGSRFHGKNNLMHYKYFLPHHYIGNKLLSFMTSVLYDAKIADMETCYKMFKRDVLEGIKLASRRFELEPEITAKILRKKYKILEIPITYNARDFNEGKKINWVDGIKAFYYLIKYRFSD